MMRLSSKDITLGAHRWTVRPLTLAQVQAIEPLVFGAPEAGTIKAAIAILRVALSRDHSQAALDLDSYEASALEIAKAMSDVLRLGGFVPDQQRNDAPGEAGAGSPPASTGPASMPA